MTWSNQRVETNRRPATRSMLSDSSPAPFALHRHSRRRSSTRVVSAIPMRLCASALLFALLAVSSCADRPQKKPEQVSGNSRTNLEETKSASLVGSWAISIADEPEQPAWVELKADEHWSFWPPRQEYVAPKQPSQVGTWFVRHGKVFLLVEQSESDKIIPGMAFAFDIKSVSSDGAVVLWGGREMRCRRIR
jgi:hypothetical protein